MLPKLHVWIVEMKDDFGRWLPTVGCALSRNDGQAELAKWRVTNPSDKFKLKKYVRAEE